MTRFQYKFIITVLVLLLIGVGGILLYPHLGPRVMVIEEKVPADETVAIVEAVGKLIVLPQGEEPTVATVTTLEELRGQPFFANAKVGDKVLIYTVARKAILYDPIANKIIEVAPLAVEVPQPTATTTTP